MGILISLGILQDTSFFSTLVLQSLPATIMVMLMHSTSMSSPVCCTDRLGLGGAEDWHPSS